jgi:hypothetical protein
MGLLALIASGLPVTREKSTKCQGGGHIWLVNSLSEDSGSSSMLLKLDSRIGNLPRVACVPCLQRLQERDQVVFVLVGKVETKTYIVEIDRVHQRGR